MLGCIFINGLLDGDPGLTKQFRHGKSINHSEHRISSKPTRQINVTDN